MTILAASYYAIGARVWCRRDGPSGALLRGVVAAVTQGPPPVTYCLRLDSKECGWAAFAELLPR